MDILKIKMYIRPMGAILREKIFQIDKNDTSLIEAIIYGRQEFRIWRPSNDDIQRLKNVLNNSKHQNK